MAAKFSPLPFRSQNHTIFPVHSSQNNLSVTRGAFQSPEPHCSLRDDDIHIRLVVYLRGLIKNLPEWLYTHRYYPMSLMPLPSV